MKFMPYFLAGLAIGVVIGIVVQGTYKDHYMRKVLIEHGCAYYAHDTGEFVIVRKDGE
jgi:hypothetical protein